MNKKKHKIFPIMLLTIFCAAMLISPGVLAQGKKLGTEKGPSKTMDPKGMVLPPPPEKAGKVTLSTSKGFDGGGRIDSIGTDFIVISDSQKQFANSVKYFDSQGEEISFSSLEIGNIVRYRLNDNRQIVSLWLEKENRPLE